MTAADYVGEPLLEWSITTVYRFRAAGPTCITSSATIEIETAIRARACARRFATTDCDRSARAPDPWYSAGPAPWRKTRSFMPTSSTRCCQEQPSTAVPSAGGDDQPRFPKRPPRVVRH
jgi:hypothetical protein